MKQKPTFIVGTGRCGCTMLSDIISKNKDFLVLSEFFVTLSPYAFSKQTLNGHEFWEILSEPRPKATHLLRHGVGIEEFLYQSKEGVAPILLTTLPFLSNQPEALYEEVMEFVLQLQTDSLRNQYTKLFNWLLEKFDKKIWIERSGSSLRFVKDIKILFPDARFIHILRDGRECAMSMSRHYAFRSTMIQSMVIEMTGMDPFEKRIPDEVKKQLGELARILPDENFDVDLFKKYEIPIERFGILWSSQIAKGLSYLDKTPSEDLLNVCYEDILRDPLQQIKRVVQFIDPHFDNLDLLIEMASEVKCDKKATWVNLQNEEKERLSNSCKFGLRLLSYS